MFPFISLVSYYDVPCVGITALRVSTGSVAAGIPPGTGTSAAAAAAAAAITAATAAAGRSGALGRPAVATSRTDREHGKPGDSGGGGGGAGGAGGGAGGRRPVTATATPVPLTSVRGVGAATVGVAENGEAMDVDAGADGALGQENGGGGQVAASRVAANGGMGMGREEDGGLGEGEAISEGEVAVLSNHRSEVGWFFVLILHIGSCL